MAGGLNLQPNFQKKKGGRGFTGPQLSEVGCWERGQWLLWGGGGRGCNFHIKKLKSET